VPTGDESATSERAPFTATVEEVKEIPGVTLLDAVDAGPAG